MIGGRRSDGLGEHLPVAIIIIDDHQRIHDFLTTLDEVIDKGVVLLDDVEGWFTNATAAHQQVPQKLWHGREERPVQGFANTLFTDRGLDFLRRHLE